MNHTASVLGKMVSAFSAEKLEAVMIGRLTKIRVAQWAI
jgi:hypothetical protein